MIYLALDLIGERIKLAVLPQESILTTGMLEELLSHVQANELKMFFTTFCMWNSIYYGLQAIQIFIIKWYC